MNEKLINEIITYNYNNFGNEFGDALVYLQQENKQYKEVIDKAIDKLYCWGEVLDADFQKIMLDILKEVE